MAKYNSENCLEIHLACREHRTQAVHDLLSRFPSLVNCRDNDGTTPLITAAAFGGGVKLLETLVRMHAEVDSRDSLGRTPLYASISGSPIQSILYLIGLGASLDSETLDSETPLTAAIVFSRRQVVKLLVESGANPNYQCRDGGTPLYYSILSKSTSLTRFLFENGGRAYGVNINGMSLIDWSIDKKNIPIVKLVAAELLKSNKGRRELVQAWKRIRNRATSFDRRIAKILQENLCR